MALQARSYEGETRTLQNQMLQVERRLEQKTKEFERLNEAHSKLQASLADQQLIISQSKQTQNDNKAALRSEIKQLEKLNSDLKHELNNCKNQVSVISIVGCFILSTLFCQPYVLILRNIKLCGGSIQSY